MDALELNTVEISDNGGPFDAVTFDPQKRSPFDFQDTTSWLCWPAVSVARIVKMLYLGTRAVVRTPRDVWLPESCMHLLLFYRRRRRQLLSLDPLDLQTTETNCVAAAT